VGREAVPRQLSHQATSPVRSVDVTDVPNKGQAIPVKQKYTVAELLEERISPLKRVEGYVVRARAPDPSKALRPLDPLKVRENVEKDWRGWFIAAGEKPPV
jgi:hypothetical protein